MSGNEAERIKALEREVRELRQNSCGKNREAVEFAALTLGDWFNHRRLLGSITGRSRSKVPSTLFRAGPGGATQPIAFQFPGRLTALQRNLLGFQ